MNNILQVPNITALPPIPNTTVVIPRVTVPNIPPPATPTVLTVPRIPLPTGPVITTAPRIQLPMPQVTLPTVTQPTVPQVTVPTVTQPTVPQVTVPTIPRVTLPTTTQPTLPRVTLPALTRPTVPRSPPRGPIPVVPAISTINQPGAIVPIVTVPAANFPTVPRIATTNTTPATPVQQTRLQTVDVQRQRREGDEPTAIVQLPTVGTPTQLAPARFPLVDVQTTRRDKQRFSPRYLRYYDEPMLIDETGPTFQPRTPTVQQRMPTVRPGLPTVQTPGLPTVQTPALPTVQPRLPTVQPGLPTVRPGLPTVRPGLPTVQPGSPTVQPGLPTVQPGLPTVQLPGLPTVQLPGLPPPIRTERIPDVPRDATVPIVNVTPQVIPATRPPGLPIVGGPQSPPTLGTTIALAPFLQSPEQLTALPPIGFRTIPGVFTRPLIPPRSPGGTILPQPTYYDPTPPNIAIGPYYQQDNPRPDEFAFQATPENTHFVQATIETARQVFPNLELFIQMAENFGLEREYSNRALYPSYMRDASTFEIFRIYRGDTANFAERLIRRLTNVGNQSVFNRETIENMEEFMNARGYESSYWGFANFTAIGNRAVARDIPLTSDNFRASITPDQAILMEAWRLKVLHGGVWDDTAFNQSVLGLRGLRGFENFRRDYQPSPVIQTIGFSKDALRDAIFTLIEKLPNRRLTRDYIRYEGEEAINEDGVNIANRKLAMSAWPSKAYYMMLYNELITRNLIQ